MILPILALGHPVLKKTAVGIDKDYPNLQQLIDNMFETMYDSHGVGLAAPQIGLSIRLFIADGTPFKDEGEEDGDDNIGSFKEVFINAEITNEEGETWKFNEGCLSIPGIREDVVRHSTLYISYFDRNWKQHHKSFNNLSARIIQHEYDHIEGKLFIDRISPFRKTVLKNKLKDISNGIVDVDYKMKFYKK